MNIDDVFFFPSHFIEIAVNAGYPADHLFH